MTGWLPSMVWVLGLLAGCGSDWSLVDEDGDGYRVADGDCWDQVAGPEGSGLNGSSIHPNAPDMSYDGVDADCQGDDDFDQDGDGYVPSEYLGLPTAGIEGSGQLPGGDCWDTPATVPSEMVPVDGFPALEALQVNPGAGDTWYDGVDADCAENDDFDQDEDGYRSAYHPDQDGAYGDDCIDGSDLDDDNPAGSTPATVNPGADETWYDGTDQDCDANDCDADGDGYDGGDGEFCVSEECDDRSALIFPDPSAQEEWYNGIDEDCDGNDGDQDGDGYWNAEYEALVSLSGGTPLDIPTGWDNDCWDDLDLDPEDIGYDSLNGFSDLEADDVHPGSGDRSYDAVDQDCEGGDDFDQDGDGYATAFYDNRDGDSGEDCIDGSSLDEDNPAALAPAEVYPGAMDEWYDGTDADCDGNSDYDQDTDGYDSDSYGGEDCDDTLPAVSPAEEETCDTSYDDDCNGTAHDENAVDCESWHLDSDGDGYGTDEEACYCEAAVDAGASGDFVSASETDCDDDDADISPAADEVCDSIDNDCDGDTDEDDASDASTWYIDYDSDGYGSDYDSLTQCEEPAGYVDNDEDCDDSDSTVNPDEIEICDDLDNDCDGEVDGEDAVG
ncbi:MAG: MopE-related protein, partial [Myxococcota bacterium]|nr:MopE-related protein [Myxococcota bacterium]